MVLLFRKRESGGKCSARECINTRKRIEEETSLSEIEMTLNKCNKCALFVLDKDKEAYHTRNAVGCKYASTYMEEVHKLGKK